jgi:uncharacterized damage-inducible protein DinB
MNPLLRDLYGHQAWADAEHWRAIGRHQPAREDPAIRARLHHIHLVQRLFRWAVDDRSTEFQLSRPEDFSSFDQLQAYGREYQDEMRRFFDAITADRLGEMITMPWMPAPPLSLTVTEALTQCAVHSHYHRGQNATRLRDLGGKPPMTDLIVWYWKGRPSPDYDGAIG